MHRYFVDANEVDTWKFDWGLIKIMCSAPITGSERLSAGMVVMEPGSGHGRHNHPDAEELIFVLSGEGEQMVEDEHGNPLIKRIRAGSLVFVPEGRYHYTKNTGWETMRVFVVYSPSGSEQAFKELPDFVGIPAETSTS